MYTKNNPHIGGVKIGKGITIGTAEQQRRYKILGQNKLTTFSEKINEMSIIVEPYVLQTQLSYRRLNVKYMKNVQTKRPQ